MNTPCYPVIDLFAGPGGLGEGFACVGNSEAPAFKSLAAIERDKFAHKTLHLRHFVREFDRRKIPAEYYAYLAGEIERDELSAKFPMQWHSAGESALKISLGEENHHLVKSLVTKKLQGNKKWALVGGPPCQAYSLVGRSRRANDPDFENDEKHFLYREYLKIITDHRPPVFVMENVKGLLSAKINGEPVIDKILNDLANPKAATSTSENGLRYRLYSLTEQGELTEGASKGAFIVRAEEYGVPQARHRMFILGVRSDLNVEPAILQKQASPTVEDVIGDLPMIRSGISKEPDSFEAWSEVISGVVKQKWFRNAFDDRGEDIRMAAGSNMMPATRSSDLVTKPQTMSDWFSDESLNAITGHEARSHMRSDLLRYFFSSLHAQGTKVSPKLANFPNELLPNHRNVEAGKAGKMFSDRFRVQVASRVSTTVTSHISKDGHYFIHYDPRQCRSLTVREAARLQTFPDNYHFEGPRTQQYHQVGNAVPPYLAKQIGAIVADVLDQMEDS
ncbi:DNA cytosine methyltransferase [Parasphingorhabdus sp.]